MRSTRPGIARLIALLAVFAVVPLILLVVLPLQMATNSLGQEATARVSDTAAVSANAISLQMASLAGLTESFSQRPELVTQSSIPGSSPQNPAHQILSQLNASNPNVRSSFLLDSNGHYLLGTTSAGVAGNDLSYRDYYKGAVNSSSSFIAGAIISVVDPSLKLVTVSKAIRGIPDRSGQEPLLAVLVLTVDVNHVFQSYVDNFVKDSGESTSIIDQNNGLVASPGLLSKSVPTTVDPHINDARNGVKSAVIAEQNRKSVIVAYAPIAGTNWVLTTSVSQKSAYAPINQFRTRVVILALVLGSVISAALALLVGSVRERDRAARDVGLSEERTRKVVETVRQSFCELDTELLITDWNAQSEVLFGWSREEIWGKNFIELLIPFDKRQQVIRLIDEVINEPDIAIKRSMLSTDMISKSEEAVPVEINVWATDVAGRRRINIFATDISERVRFEREQELVVKRQRRLLEELRTADKAKNDFISTISHELRTPLTSIVGYLEMLDDGYGGELSANQTSMLDVIDRNSRRLLSLIEDVLTLSRIESGAFKGRSIAVEVSSLVSGAVQTLVPTARAKSLELAVDVPKEVGWVRGDHSQLERVLLNLISNAVKFTPEGGKVTIHGYRQEDLVTLTVSDTGIGIPIEEQHRLFSRFFRSSTAQDQAIQGTGLGLTIVKSIVERHGGTINIQSTEGSGTTVIVEFPSVDAETPTSTVL